MQKYNCKNCGAELYWDADKGALFCEYCESIYSVHDFEDLTVNSENVETVNTEEQVETNEKMVVYQCTNCGAELITSDKTMATTCAYCGRAVTIVEKSVGDFRPEKIIPFEIDKQKAISLYKEYIEKSPIAPKELFKESTIEKMQGLYVPFWLYSALVEGKTFFECEKNSVRNSGDYRVTTHNIYNVEVDTNSTFWYVPVDAAIKLDNTLMDALDPYSIEKFVDYNPAYMAGYFAEQFDDNKDKTSGRANDKISKAISNLAKGKITGYNKVSLSSNNINYKQEVVNYGMLPIWLLNVDYNNEKYTYAINGETGKVVGKIPISQSRLVKRSLRTVGKWYIALLILSGICAYLGVHPLSIFLLFL